MVDSAIKNEEDKKEYFDSEDELELKMLQLTEWVKESKCFIAFTGAGISTSCGISDFRSGMNTCLEVGPGVWEKGANKDKVDKEKEKTYKKVSMLEAVPSLTHMALVKLANEGILKYCISQNVDGLHRKSGFPKEKLAELHGNTNLERCEKCNADYFRDFSVRNAKEVHDHRTGRKCTKKNCGGELKDSIINFKEPLPENELNMGYYYSKIADLHLVLGSSLRVQPAADMPVQTIDNNGKVVIVNLQKTPLSDVAALCIYAKIDTVMERLMKNLLVEIPKWTVTRRIIFRRTVSNGNYVVTMSGLDTDGSVYSIVRKSRVQFENKETVEVKGDPWELTLPKSAVECLSVTLGFQGYYDEPDLLIKVDFKTMNEVMFVLEYYPMENKWKNVDIFDFSEFDKDLNEINNEDNKTKNNQSKEKNKTNNSVSNSGVNETSKQEKNKGKDLDKKNNK